MKGNSRESRARRIVEMFHGAPLSDEAWAVAREPGATLGDTLEWVPPRLKEWGLAASIGVYRSSAAVARAPSVVHLAEECRLLLRDERCPPFESLDDAHQWLLFFGCWPEAYFNRLSGRPLSEDAGIDWPARGRVAPADTKPADRYFEEIKTSIRRKLVARGCLATDYLLGRFFLLGPVVYLPGTERFNLGAVEQRRGIGKVPNALLMLDPRNQVLPGDVPYWATTEPLVDLACYGKMVADEAGCWSLAQAAAFILTGQYPELPRLRVWTDALPGGKSRSFLEILGVLGSRELREVHSILREAAGLKGKKSLTPEDVELIAFIEDETRGQKWPVRLNTWRKRHPGARIKTPSGFQNAYTRACRRRDRP